MLNCCVVYGMLPLYFYHGNRPKSNLTCRACFSKLLVTKKKKKREKLALSYLPCPTLPTFILIKLYFHTHKIYKLNFINLGLNHDKKNIFMVAVKFKKKKSTYPSYNSKGGAYLNQ